MLTDHLDDDADAASGCTTDDLAELDNIRWRIETDLFHLKQMMKMDVLRHADDASQNIIRLKVNPDRHEPRRAKRPKDRYTYITRPRGELKKTLGITVKTA